jgi:hypothetical protein
MTTNQGYLIIEIDHEDDTVLVQDKQLMALIGKDKKHWIITNSPYIWVRLISVTKEPYQVGGWLFGELSHSAKDSWYKGIPTLTVDYYDEFDEDE